jgi:hypothetical protein
MENNMRRILKASVFVLAATAASAASAAVTFFEFENFRGRQMVTEGVIPNFVERGFNDRATSAIVEGPPVEVCVDINFQGGCTILNPGRYPTLGELRQRISSMRPLGPMDQRGIYDRGDRGDSRADRGDRGDRRGRYASATLFSGPNMTGRSFTLGGQGAPDLQGFNDRASSLVVDSGYWIFCSEPGFGGECRTFGPGRYDTLPPDLNNRISSGRRIQNDYPYARNPER